jgi:hypothetical protein
MDKKSHKAIIHILLLLQIIGQEGHINHCFLAKKIQKIENIYKKIFYNSKIIILPLHLLKKIWVNNH